MKRCPKCKSEQFTKYGSVKGKQRYKCKDCDCQFTRFDKKGFSSEIKRFALKLYLEGLGFRAIGRLLKVSNVSILNWIREFAKELPPAKSPPAEVSVLNIDEMWHYIGVKKKTIGLHTLSMHQLVGYFPEQWVVVAHTICSESGDE